MFSVNNLCNSEYSSLATDRKILWRTVTVVLLHTRWGRKDSLHLIGFFQTFIVWSKWSNKKKLKCLDFVAGSVADLLSQLPYFCDGSIFVACAVEPGVLLGVLPSVNSSLPKEAACLLWLVHIGLGNSPSKHLWQHWSLYGSGSLMPVWELVIATGLLNCELICLALCAPFLPQSTPKFSNDRKRAG